MVIDQQVTPGRPSAWERGDTDNKHMRWDDKDDEDVHAVFKAFHSFKDRKNIYYCSKKKKKESKMELKVLALQDLFRNR